MTGGGLGTRVDRHVPGAPAWVGLAAPDVAAARWFYGELFGWSYLEEPIRDDVHATCLLHGEPVAGITVPRVVAEQATGWITYLAVDDVDDVTARARELGATVRMPPTTFPAAGRAAVIEDPQRAHVGFFQPGIRRGVRLLNEPGALCWNDLNTPEPEASTAFYQELFGYDTTELRAADGSRYLLLTLDGQPIAGLLALEDALMSSMPARWLTHFATADLEAAIARVRALGSTLVMGPLNSPYGPCAVVRDQQSAAFYLTEVKEPLR